MRAYTSLLRVRFLSGLQYRAAAIGGLATQAFWGLMLVFIYDAFYKGGAPVGMTYQELVSFVWLQQSFYSLLIVYDWDYELLETITQGMISYELCRPVNIYMTWYVKLFSKRLARVALRFSPIIVMGLLMPQPYNLAAPSSAAALLLFAITLLLGALLLVSIQMLSYISIFKTMSPLGSIGITAAVCEFFSGMIIPVPLMPDALQRISTALPFRWCADFPLRVYSGNIAVSEALTGVGVQALWCVALTAVGAAIMRRVTRLSVVQGG